MTIYLNDWEASGKDGMMSDFCIKDGDIQDADIILASYTYEDYSGDAYVLFKRDGKLFEVFGSHCSCYGLEDQWSPEETTKEAIIHRLDKGTWGEKEKASDLIRDYLNDHH